MNPLKKISLLLFIILGIIWLYTNSLIGVNETAKGYLLELKEELERSNLKANYFVLSGRRWKLDNYILTKLGGAASKSQHLSGTAIDIIVLDVNKDGKRNAKDVNLVYNILDKKIIGNKGGLGTYKKGNGFFNEQMVHFDARGKLARWNR